MIQRFSAAAGFAAAIAAGATAMAQTASPFPPGYEAAYKAYLDGLPPGGRALAWLTRFEGPSSPPRPLKIDGRTVTYMFGCRTHACDTNNVNLFLSPDRTSVRAVIRVNGAQTLLGGAGPAELACVKALDASGGVAEAC